jgi:hypothetical protein
MWFDSTSMILSLQNNQKNIKTAQQQKQKTAMQNDFRIVSDGRNPRLVCK